MSQRNQGLTHFWAAADLLRDQMSVEYARDVFANLLFYRWVDEEAERSPTFRDAVFAMQSKRYRWRAALDDHNHDFGTFLHGEVYPFLGALDRVAPDIAFFFRFVGAAGPNDALREVARSLENVDVHAWTAEDAAELVDGLVPTGRGLERTPEAVRQLFAEVLAVRPNERVLDLACGTGGLLHDVALHRSRAGHMLGPSLGIDIQPTALKYARLRFLLARMPLPELRLGDALSAEQLPDSDFGRFDVVVCDPPLGRLSQRAAQTRAFETNTAQRELLFLQLAMSCLAPGGRAAILLPPSFFHLSGPTREVREALFGNFVAEAIFALPRGAIPESALEPLAVFFRRPKPEEQRPTQLLFIEATAKESLEAFVPRAIAAFEHGAVEGQSVDLEALRRVDYNILKLRRAGPGKPERAAPELGLAIQGLHSRWRQVEEQLNRLGELAKTTPENFRLQELIVRVRAPHHEAAQSWLLTLDQIEPRTGRVIEKRRGDLSTGKSSGMVPFSAGDILFSRLNPHLGKAIVADEPGYCVSDLVPFRVDSSRVIPNFVAWVMRRPSFVEQARRAAVGTTLPRISVEDLLSMSIAVPSLKDQAAAVDALEAAAATAREIHSLGLLADALRESVFNRLLGDDTVGGGT